MMAARLIELRRVLKNTGSLYLHCDPTASHYLKILLDGIFGNHCFRNEIIWKRTTTHSDSKTWSRVADVILFYTKSDHFTWNTPREPHSAEYIESKYRHDDGDNRRYMLDNMTSPNPRPNMMYDWRGFPFPARGWRYSKETMARLDKEGRIWYPRYPDGAFDTNKRPRLKRYLDEMSGGGVMGTAWTDIHPVNSQAQERIGYPTQKPLALLQRIITASSNPEDVVLDPFCGCGTAIHAAEKLGRAWIGIDVTHIAIQIIQDRLNHHFPNCKFEVFGRPHDLAGAAELFKVDPYQFQWWATWLVGGQPRGDKKKGANRGVDGEIFFKMAANEDGRAVISVKGGKHLTPAMVSELCAVREREHADIGIFVCLTKPSREMKTNAAAAGFIDGQFPRVQILTIEELLSGQRPRLPPVYDTITAAHAARRMPKQNARDLTPAELRREPQMKFVIAGPGKQRPQPNLPLGEPILTSPRAKSREGLTAHTRLTSQTSYPPSYRNDTKGSRRRNKPLRTKTTFAKAGKIGAPANSKMTTAQTHD
jgi:site-specific DNA-methyltransferase (adenine-specific)